MDKVDEIVAQWHRERADLDVGPMALLGRYKQAYNLLSKEMARTFAAHDLNPASFDVLATLRRAGPPHALSPGDLLKSMMVTSGTMTNRIDQLVKAGLVERQKHPEDGRKFVIALTAEGFARIDRAVTDHVATQHGLVADLSAAEQAELNRLLTLFLAQLEKKVEP